MEEIIIDAGGHKITAWYSPPANDIQKVVMFFHGNASAVYSNYDVFNDLIRKGYGVWSVGYSGYPGSDGKASQKAILRGAEQQYDMLLRKSILPDNLVYFGTSLGSGVAAQLAAKHKPTLLIMDAPFNSILDMGRKNTAFLPLSLLMQDKFRSDIALQDLDVPLIWTHGTADNVIPISQGQKLYDNYTGPKTAHIFEGGQHTNLWSLGAKYVVLEALAVN